MPGKKSKISSNARRRRRLLYEAYLKMYKEEGEKAHLLPRSYFYDRLADKTGYSPTSVMIYLSQEIKQNG
jgi:hypothetical protein